MAQTFANLSEAAQELRTWLVEAALPLWANAGRDAERGSFQEALTLAGEPWPATRRVRVQARQVWVYASAAREGLDEAYGEIARRAYGFMRDHYRRGDGLFVRAADAEGRATDTTALLYDQAFVLLAMAAVGAREDAQSLRTALEPLRHAAGGFREEGARPFQANAHMHLLEAALAWEAAGAADWSGVADEVAELALARFIEPQRGVLHEFFDAEWRILDEAAGGLIEPGHQFEWAWLLDRWGEARGRADVRQLARRLYATGLKGVDGESGLVMSALAADLTVRDRATRSWAQTEYLKAALRLGDAAGALSAAGAMTRYLETAKPGTWIDRFTAERTPVEEPAPATSLYHFAGAIIPLMATPPGSR